MQSGLNSVYNDEHTTDVWQQVLRGYNWSVQGSNGWNAAQLNQPRGSTLTFQRTKAGVSCGTGLRHGVTMHPGGRHLRGVMTLMPHGVTQSTACEQQPNYHYTNNHYHNYNYWDQ